MKNKQLILASQSPRRKELMEDVGLVFECIPSNAEEIFPADQTIEDAIEDVAFQKANDIFLKHPDAIVIGCDTMVVDGNQKLGKPKSKEDAYHMLTSLSGKTHRVISGVAILSKDKKITFHDITYVTFYDIEDDLLETYLNSDEPYDKAGAYGIQGKGRLFVKEIKGDYFNVVGLPISRVYRALKEVM